MRTYRFDKGRKLACIAAAAACAAGAVCASIYSQMVSHMKEICEYKGRQTANEIVSDAIDEQLAKEPDDYIDIVYGENGRIVVPSSHFASQAG